MYVRYRVERLNGDGLGPPMDHDDALDVIARRLTRLPDGEVLRVKKLTFELPPEGPPGGHVYTRGATRLYRGTVAHRPKVGWAGGFVCKLTADGAISQHAIRAKVGGQLTDAGNAFDWVAPEEVEAQGSQAVVDWLWDLANFHVAQARAWSRDSSEGLPSSEVIFRDRKWKLSTNRWGPYGGAFHWSHEHNSAAPYVDRAASCATG